VFFLLDIFGGLGDGALDEGLDKVVQDGDAVGEGAGVVDSPEGADTGADGLDFLDCGEGFCEGGLLLTAAEERRWNREF